MTENSEIEQTGGNPEEPQPEDQAKGPGGRPSKYRPEMCDQVIELMGDGASLVEVAAKLGICKDTLHEWKKTNVEFSDSIKRGVQLSAAWWEEKGRTNLENKDFSYTGWYMNMKNRFGWKDKHENQITGKDGESLKFPVYFVGSDASKD
ncbi:MAG: hypothetical protein IH886_05335 [Nitrospinae bacterium]|nr:hypothetical protein [Nitrospinota bacterium]